VTCRAGARLCPCRPLAAPPRAPAPPRLLPRPLRPDWSPQTGRPPSAGSWPAPSQTLPQAARTALPRPRPPRRPPSPRAACRRAAPARLAPAARVSCPRPPKRRAHRRRPGPRARPTRWRARMARAMHAARPAAQPRSRPAAAAPACRPAEAAAATAASPPRPLHPRSVTCSNVRQHARLMQSKRTCSRLQRVFRSREHGQGGQACSAQAVKADLQPWRNTAAWGTTDSLCIHYNSTLHVACPRPLGTAHLRHGIERHHDAPRGFRHGRAARGPSPRAAPGFPRRRQRQRAHLPAAQRPAQARVEGRAAGLPDAPLGAVAGHAPPHRPLAAGRRQARAQQRRTGAAT